MSLGLDVRLQGITRPERMREHSGILSHRFHKDHSGLNMRRLPLLLTGTGLVLLGYLLGSAGGLAPQMLRAEAEEKTEKPDQEKGPENTPNAETGADEKPAAEEASQNPPQEGISPATQEKIKVAYDALADAADALEKEGFYRAATKEVNVFGVLSGGVDAIGDLQSGNGVDPETFAAIYGGTIKPEVQELLQRDADHHITYNGKLVQMYPVSEIRRRFLMRAQLTGQIKPQDIAPQQKAPEKSEAAK